MCRSLLKKLLEKEYGPAICGGVEETQGWFTIGAERPLSKMPKEIDAVSVETVVQELHASQHVCYQKCPEAQESTKLPAGASYTLFRWTSKQEKELKELRLRRSGDNNDDSSNGQ